MSRNWKGGSTTAWRRVRAVVLLRDSYRCQLRIPNVCTTEATQVHHLLGRDISGDDPRYLVAACRPCNLKAGQPGHQQPKRVSNW